MNIRAATRTAAMTSKSLYCNNWLLCLHKACSHAMLGMLHCAYATNSTAVAGYIPCICAVSGRLSYVYRSVADLCAVCSLIQNGLQP